MIAIGFGFGRPGGQGANPTPAKAKRYVCAKCGVTALWSLSAPPASVVCARCGVADWAVEKPV